MTLRIVIVDDEPLALTLLASILDDAVDVELVARCLNGYEAIDAVIEHQPDVLFLDIHMPGLNGFDVISKIQSDIMPLVIFTTAYADYAVEAFQVQAIDYVLKPLEDHMIMTSLERARAAIDGGYNKRRKPKLLTALHEISDKVKERSGETVRSTLMVKDSEKIALLETRSIQWLEAAGDYVCIHSRDNARLVRSTLKSIEDELEQVRFQRIHRSTIINLEHLSEITPTKKGEAIVQMNDGTRLKVSRKYGSDLRARLT